MWREFKPEKQKVLFFLPTLPLMGIPGENYITHDSAVNLHQSEAKQAHFSGHPLPWSTMDILMEIIMESP